jgi:pantothenate synthetase
MTRNEKRKMLADMARNPELSARERQMAIDLDNKMEDEYKTILSGSVNVAKLEDIL